MTIDDQHTSAPQMRHPLAQASNDQPAAANKIAVVRAVAAVAWAVAFVVAIGSKAPTADSLLPAAAASILTTYPLIDVFASLVGARGATAGRALYFNAAVSTAGAIGIGIAAFGADAAAVLAAFGAWAAVSGAIQFGLAARGRASKGGHVAMLVSGGLSTLAGLSFLAFSRNEDVNLRTLAGYMVLGAVLYIVSGHRQAG